MADADDASKVRADKTYNQILAKQEARLSKDALVEKRAVQLTKYFIKSRENDIKADLDAQAEQSRRNFERSMQKTRDAGEAEAAFALMVKEEKIVISEHMQEMGRQRRAEELKAKTEREEREKWQQARNLFERFQAEERAKLLQEREKQRLAKQKERLEKSEAVRKEAQEQQEQEISAAQQKRQADAAKAVERKKKLAKEGREAAKETASTVDRKLQEAEQRRREHKQKAQEVYRERVEQVFQKVEECERKREEIRQEKHKKLLDKALQFEARTKGPRLLQPELQEDDESADGSESPWKQGERGKGHAKGRGLSKQATSGGQDMQAGAGSEPKKGENAGDKKQEDHGPASPRICYDSPELINANNLAHKDYVRRCADLRQASQKMLMQKKFKTLADAAESREDSIDDTCSVRMRSLHSMYITQKAKGARGGAGAASSSGAATARTPRKVHRCGLCEREFPLESFTGSALQKNLDRFKLMQRRGDTPFGNAQAMNAGAGTSAGQDRPPDGNGTGPAKAEERMLPGVRLYDQEVPLCAVCNHRVRINSS